MRLLSREIVITDIVLLARLLEVELWKRHPRLLPTLSNLLSSFLILDCHNISFEEGGTQGIKNWYTKCCFPIMISVAGVQCQSSSCNQLAATSEHNAVANQARRNNRIRIDIHFKVNEPNSEDLLEPKLVQIGASQPPFPMSIPPLR